MGEIFLYGTIYFWLLVFAEIFLLGIFVSTQRAGLSVFSVIAFGCLIHFCGDVNILAWAKVHWVELIGYVIGYFFFGVAYMYWRWLAYNHEKLEDILEIVESYYPLAERKNDPKVMEKAKDYIQEQKDSIKFNSKEMLINWMTFWIISAPIYLSSDFVTKVSTMIYRKLVASLHQISDRVFANVPEDLK